MKLPIQLHLFHSVINGGQIKKEEERQDKFNNDIHNLYQHQKNIKLNDLLTPEPRFNNIIQDELKQRNRKQQEFNNTRDRKAILHEQLLNTIQKEKQKKQN